MSAGAEGPLAGLLVVSVEQAVAAPFATSRLADAGARVIKVERPEGDFARAYDRVVDGECAWFVWLNRGKESVVLDIKDAGDNALLHRIVARADVFVQKPRAGCRRAGGIRLGRTPAPPSAPHHLRHQRLWRVRPLCRDEGLRLPRPVRIGGSPR